MAWIESHQALRTHPKTLKAARALGIRPVHLMGHLHALWHWALDLADDGNLSKFDSTDIALGADWDGDPDEFVEALVACGFGDGPGFLSRNGSYGHPDEGLVGDLVLHDWWDYAGKLVSRRLKDRERKARARAESEGVSADIPGNSTAIPEDVQGMSDGSPQDVQRSAGNDLYQPTNQPTEPTDSDAVAPEVSRLCELLADAVEAHGKVGRPKIGPKWHDDMRLLLARGPTDMEPAKIEPERVERAIQVVFSQLDTPDPGSSFCWADQVRSPGALRKHWTSIRLAAKSAVSVRTQATEWVDPHEVSA